MATMCNDQVLAIYRNTVQLIGNHGETNVYMMRHLWNRQQTFISAIQHTISKLLKRYSKAKRTRAPAYSRALRRIKGGFQRGVKRSSGPNSRVPGGDRVAVR